MINCLVDNCEGLPRKRGWCEKHYQRWRIHGDVNYSSVKKTCSVENCENKHLGKGYCSIHYGRFHRHGDPLVSIKASPGEAKPFQDTDGYVLVPYQYDHPNAKSNGYIREHILVMSQILGRSLLPGENVHHKNGLRSDNRPENLELWVKHQPAGQRTEDLVDWARQMLGRYGTTEEQTKYGYPTREED